MGESFRLAADKETDEGSYRFLKTLCSVLSALGQHLTALWGCANSPIEGPPDNFALYMGAIMAFFDHPSMVSAPILS